VTKNNALRLLLVFSITILLVATILVRRDYQDSWVLEGIELPFLLFVSIFTCVFFSERKVSWFVSLAVLARVVFVLVSSLKYVWFQGVFIDQQLQFNLASYVFSTGTISTQAVTTSFSFYIGSPLLHVLTAMISLVTGISIVDSMKLIPVLLAPLVPLMTYCILKLLKLDHEKNILKLSLFFSAIPLADTQLLVAGSLFGVPLALLSLFTLVAALQKHDRRYWLLCAFFLVALAAAHSVSSFILSAIIAGVFIIQRFPRFKPKFHLRSVTALAVVIIGLSWLMFPAYFTMQEISRDFLISVPTGSAPRAEAIAPTFIQLLQVSPFSAVETFIVFYGADIAFIILTLISLIFLLKMRRNQNAASSFLVLFTILMFFAILLGLGINIGARRGLILGRMVTPLFAGIAVYYCVRTKKWLIPIIIAALLLFSTVQFYNCQPMLPSANVLNKNLSSDVPIAFVTNVNSVYQRQSVSFALHYINSGRITSDSNTRNQIAGVASSDFMSVHVLNNNPLDPLDPDLSYDYYMIHFPGKAGQITESASARDPVLIGETIANNSVIYNNGESFVLVP
jgi:hypothetical protein